MIGYIAIYDNFYYSQVSLAVEDDSSEQCQEEQELKELKNRYKDLFEVFRDSFIYSNKICYN